MLIILSGLPGVGKTAIARELAGRMGAVHLRIDSIEQAIRDSRGDEAPIDDVGYRVAYAIAEDNLRLGRVIIADSVNPIQLTRESWLDVARRTDVQALEIEVICSDIDEHRSRVNTRITDVRGLRLPSWNEVLSREYAPWDREHIVLDTATHTIDQNVKTVLETIDQLQLGCERLMR